MLRYLSASTFAVMMLALTSGAAAQVALPAATASPGAAVSVVGGLSAGSSASGAALGGAFTFDFNDRLALEATGTWLDRGVGSDALHMNVGLLVNLLPAGSRAVPYVAVGGGFYRASFDLDNNRFFGMMDSQYPAGTPMVPLQGMAGYGMMGGGYYGPSGTMGSWNPGTQGAWPGATFTLDQMPMFYADRLGPMSVPQNGMWGMRSFTDPAITVGGGVNANLGDHLFVRPDARALVVFGNGGSYTVGLLSFSLGYRF